MSIRKKNKIIQEKEKTENLQKSQNLVQNWERTGRGRSGPESNQIIPVQKKLCFWFRSRLVPVWSGFVPGHNPTYTTLVLNLVPKSYHIENQTPSNENQA